jgi:uncharacterized protein
MKNSSFPILAGNKYYCSTKLFWPKIGISMNEFIERYGEWALVAGAVEGIGAAFSEALAREGMNLIMVDKNEKALKELSSLLKKSYNITTVILVSDLSENASLKSCTDALSSTACRLLVYVPAYSHVISFNKLSEKELDLFLNLNCRTPLHLLHSFTGIIPVEKQSGIILVSSLAGLIGPPLSAVYAGTKAFNILLAESLHSEFRKKSVDVEVCCAGITSTPTYLSSKPAGKYAERNAMRPSDVADYALKKLGKNTICIPGWKNRLSFFFLLKLLPRRVAARIVARSMLKIYPE